jgi:hypothetical protein
MNMSKGSQRRPTDEYKYRDNYERIFRKENQGPDCNKGRSGVQDQAVKTNDSGSSKDVKGV